MTRPAGPSTDWRDLVRRRDVLGRVVRELDGPAPLLAESLRWRREVRRGAVVERVVEALVTKGDTVLDIGASRGLFTARLLRLVGRRGIVHAFEPNPGNAARLEQMARRRPNLVLHGVALSSRVGTASLMVPVVDGEQWAGLGSLEDPRRKMDTEVATVDVPVTTVDESIGTAAPTFVKIDVEGHEDEVLAGARALSPGCTSLLIEIEQRHRGNDPRLLIDRLMSRGWDGWAAFADGLRPVAEFDLERDQTRHVTDEPTGVMPADYVHNFLFTPPGVGVGRFLARA